MSETVETKPLKEPVEQETKSTESEKPAGTIESTKPASETSVEPVAKESAVKKNTKNVQKIGEEVAVILVRGLINIRHDIRQAMDSLRLRRKNVCVVRKMTPELKGNIMKIKDYIAWGEIDSETLKLLKDKRGEEDSEGKLKPFFRLNPPRKGFGRKGIKKPYSLGGALGYRGKDINDLIKRML